MLRSGITLGLAVVVGGVTALAVAQSRSSTPTAHRGAAAAASTPHPVGMTVVPEPSRSPRPNAPTFPPAATAPQPAGFRVSLNRAAPPAPCDVPGEKAANAWDTPGDNWPATPQQLFQASELVAVVHPVEQRAYWQRVAGNPGDPPVRLAFRGETTTNFTIVRLFKGEAPSGWVQVTEEGALPNALPTCSNLGYEIQNSPVTRIDHDYVLFLQRGTDGLYEIFGSYDRFPLIDGDVHAESDLLRDAYAIKIKPQPVNDFLASLTG